MENDNKEQFLEQSLIEEPENGISLSRFHNLSNMSISNSTEKQKQENTTHFFDQGSDYKVPASLTQAKKHFDYSVFGVPKPKPKICPSCLENKKEPFKLIVNLDSTPEANSTENLYLKVSNIYTVVLLANLVPSLYTLFSFQQIYFKTHPESRTISYYWRSLWNFDQNMFDVKSKQDVPQYQKIHYMGNWLNFIAICFVSFYISWKIKKEILLSYLRQNNIKPSYCDFSVLFPYLKADTSREDIKIGIQEYMTSKNYPLDHFQIEKITMIRSFNKEQQLTSDIMNEKSKQKAIEKELENPVKTGIMTKRFLWILEKRLKKVKKRIKKLKNQLEIEKLKKTTTREGQCCAAIVTFATTLQRDLFLSMSFRKGMSFPYVKINGVLATANLAPSINQIGWSNASYTYKLATASQKRFEMYKDSFSIFILFLVFITSYFLKSSPKFDLISPIISIIFSALSGKLRRLLIFQLKTIFYDAVLRYEITMLTIYRLIISSVSVILTVYFSLTGHATDLFSCFSNVMIRYFIIKLGCMPLLTLFPPTEVYKSLRRRFISFKYKNTPESVPMVQKDLDKYFERDEVRVVDLISKLEYLMFLGVVVYPFFPLIGVMSFLTLLVLRMSEKYKMLRRYKRFDRVNTILKKKLLAGPLSMYLIWVMLRLILCLLSSIFYRQNFGFRYFWWELFRDSVCLICVAYNAEGYISIFKSNEARETIWLYGKHTPLIKELSEYSESLSHQIKRIFEKIKESELSEGEKKEKKEIAISETYEKSRVYRKKMIDEYVKELNPSDYYSYCELDFEDDYDRANPSSKSIATKLFRKKKLKRLEQRGGI